MAEELELPCVASLDDVFSGDFLLLLATTLGGRFKLVGRAEFLAFRYKPHALQIVDPCGDLLQSGVLVVPQLLQGRS